MYPQTHCKLLTHLLLIRYLYLFSLIEGEGINEKKNKKTTIIFFSKFSLMFSTMKEKNIWEWVSLHQPLPCKLSHKKLLFTASFNDHIILILLIWLFS